MTINKDKLTTVLGAIGAGVATVQPIVNSMSNQSLHTQDYVQLTMALLLGIFGWATNKK